MKRSRSVEDVEGPWNDPQFDSSVINHCRRNWNEPAHRLSNEVLAMFIRQRIALSLVVPEARQRIASGFDDDTEQYDGELLQALRGLGQE